MADPIQVVVIVVALAAGAFVKGVTGTGLPQVAIPVMATFIGVQETVIIMSIPGVVANLWLVVAHGRSAGQTRDLPLLVLTGVGGAVIGTVLLTTVDARWLSLVLAVLVVAYVTVRLVSPHISLGRSTSRWLSPPVGLAAGALQGASGVSGPLLSTYLHSFTLAPSAYIFSLSTLFLVFSVTQGLTLVALGAYTTTLVAEGLLALVPVAVMLPVGTWLSRRMQVETFSKVVLVVLLAAATALVWQAVGG